MERPQTYGMDHKYDMLYARLEEGIVGEFEGIDFTIERMKTPDDRIHIIGIRKSDGVRVEIISNLEILDSAIYNINIDPIAHLQSTIVNQLSCR